MFFSSKVAKCFNNSFFKKKEETITFFDAFICFMLLLSKTPYMTYNTKLINKEKSQNGFGVFNK